MWRVSANRSESPLCRQSAKKGAKTMNYTDFEHRFLKICRNNKKKYPLDNDIKYFYDKYEQTYKLIKNKKMAEKMVTFTKFSREKKLMYYEEENCVED